MNRHSGFTLRELLAVVAIIGCLCTLFLPATRGAREASRRTTCANQMKQLGMGVHAYHELHSVLPPAGTLVDEIDASQGPRVGWQVRILPFCDQSRLYDRINMNSPRASWEILATPKEPKMRLVSHQIPYAMCPDDDTPSRYAHWEPLSNSEHAGGVFQYAQTSYTGNLGSQLVEAGGQCDFYYPNMTDAGFKTRHGLTNKGGFTSHEVSGVLCEKMFGPITLGDIKDGTSNTFLAGETIGRCNRNNARGWWEDASYGNARGTVVTPLNIFSTCVSSRDEASRRGYIHANCADELPFLQANLTWGYRSFHPAGANFLMCDGSLQFINNDIHYTIYQAYGDRDDSGPV